MTMLRSNLARILPIIALLAIATSALAQQDAPATLKEGLQRLQELRDELRWDEALEVAATLVEAYPESVEAVLWRGIAYEAIGQEEAARADFERAVELAPSNLRAQYYRVRTSEPSLDREAYEAAMRAFVDRCADAIEADPVDPEAYLHRGLALKVLGDVYAGEAEVRHVLELDPRNVDALNGLLEFLTRFRQNERMQFLERIIELRPRHVHAREELGSIYDTERRTDQAAEQYRESVQINPLRGYAHGLLAALYWRRYGDIDRALAAAERGIEVEPTHPTCWNVKARVLLEGRGDARAAIEVVDEALASVGESDPLYVTKSKALERLGRNEEALTMLKDAIERASVGYVLRYERTRLLYLMGRYEEAWREVHAMDEQAQRLGLTAHFGLRETLREAMPEPPANTEDAQQHADEGN